MNERWTYCNHKTFIFISVFIGVGRNLIRTISSIYSLSVRIVNWFQILFCQLSIEDTKTKQNKRTNFCFLLFYHYLTCLVDLMIMHIFYYQPFGTCFFPSFLPHVCVCIWPPPLLPPTTTTTKIEEQEHSNTSGRLLFEDYSKSFLYLCFCEPLLFILLFILVSFIIYSHSIQRLQRCLYTQ